MFLGDSGSMLIGLALGAMAIRSSIKGPATVALAAPVAVWAIPILDSAGRHRAAQIDGPQRVCHRPRPFAPLPDG